MSPNPKAKFLSVAVALSAIGLGLAHASVSQDLGHLSVEELSAKLKAPKAPPAAHLQVLASVGPLEYLYGAEVTVKDALGIVVAKGKTNSRGSIIFDLSPQRLAVAFRPLKFTTSGGQIIGQSGNQTSGPAFYGHLQGQISKVPVGKHTIAYLDLISTSASVMKSKTKSYDSSVKAVRAALSIGKGFPVNGIRFTNNHVGATQLQAATEAYGGYDRYVRNMVDRIDHRQKITELTPPIYAAQTSPTNTPKNATAAVLNNALRPSETQSLQAQTSQATSPYPQCNVPLGNGSSTSASTEIIQDFGVASLQILLGYAGVPSSYANIVGMLLTGGATGSPSNSALQAVDAQLACISAQIGYLSEQVGELTLLTDVDQNTQCGNDVVYQYNLYSGLVSEAQNCTSSTCQLNSSNPSLIADLPSWSPSSDIVSGTCAGPTGTNNMLFGSAGGQGAAWLQLNSNYQSTNGGYAWYTALQVQQLQQFLSYWGTIEYDLFVLTNEYNNYYQLFENAQIAAGNVSGSQTVCTSGSTSSTPTYCVAQSNIANAYPPDLYSDEIGIWNNSTGTGAGLAINPFPAGLAIHNPLSNPTKAEGDQTGVGPLYIYNTSGNQSTWSADASAPGASNDANSYYGATSSSYTVFNGYGINPNGLPSAVEQFSNPQAQRTLQPTSSQVASLTQNNYLQQGSGSLTSWQFFVNAINQPVPSGYSFPIASTWGGLTATNSQSNGTGFFTSDNVSVLQVNKYQSQPDCNGGTQYCLQTLDVFNNTIGLYQWNYENSDGDNADPKAPGNYPIFGALLGRTWWAAYSSNNPPQSYAPPQPCTVNSSTYVAATSTTAAYCSQ